MAYTVLARRYRSTSFGEVIGQEPIAQTLRAAIAQNRVAHAYLFTGTRGVGKTSMARIFARALNAPDTVSDAPKLGEETDSPETDYPAKDVQERMAEAIMRGDDLNVIEIDAASNRSVEEARQLIAGATLSPTGNARFKVYIIDEVHMLTREAFNTLLKTMEEPPAHVKFILATTEPHKVPPTIQSRCQRFDFRNIPVAKIAGHLRDVLKKEKVKADEEVIFQVARLANGSMRDALSLLDRLIATGQSPLTLQVLEQMFGLPDQQLVHNLVDALAEGDVKAALQRTADLLNHGIGQDQVIDVLVERLRQLMLIAACGPDSDLVELSEDARAQAAAQAAKFDAPALTYMIALLENLSRATKASSSPRALLDAAIVRLALAEKMADVTALLAGDGRGAIEKKKPSVAPARRERRRARCSRLHRRHDPLATNPPPRPLNAPRPLRRRPLARATRKPSGRRCSTGCATNPRRRGCGSWRWTVLRATPASCGRCPGTGRCWGSSRRHDSNRWRGNFRRCGVCAHDWCCRHRRPRRRSRPINPAKRRAGA